MVSGMSEDVNDPSANTRAFQAWVDKGVPPAEEPKRSKTPLIIGVAVAVVVVAVVLILALG
jgi:antibiotic biosynthesis monooxygenase (ABM) superfamily enzyme